MLKQGFDYYQNKPYGRILNISLMLESLIFAAMYETITYDILYNSVIILEDIAFSKSIASRVTNLGRKELSTKHVVDSISNNLELSTVKMKPVKEEEKLVTITYQKPKVDVDLLRETLNVKSNKDVGIKTFEYYKDAEC